MSKKHYVVWKGAKTGVFDNWATVKAVTAGRPDAQFMGFPSKVEAEQAFQSTYSKALMKRSLAKSNGSAPTKVASTSSAPSFSASAPSETSVADFAIYCDGACSPNPGKSGTGMAIYENGIVTELWYGLHQKMGTNNTAELNGLLEAFRYAKPIIEAGKAVQVLSDSKYSIDCITKWASGWQRKGWTRGKGEEIKNLEIIKEGYALYLQLRTNLSIKHVKGHANIEGNELSDRMAVYARINQEVGFKKFEKPINVADILAMASG